MKQHQASPGRRRDCRGCGESSSSLTGVQGTYGMGRGVPPRRARRRHRCRFSSCVAQTGYDHAYVACLSPAPSASPGLVIAGGRRAEPWRLVPLSDKDSCVESLTIATEAERADPAADSRCSPLKPAQVLSSHVQVSCCRALLVRRKLPSPLKTFSAFFQRFDLAVQGVQPLDEVKFHRRA